MTEKDGFPFSWERHKKKTGSMNQTSTSPSPLKGGGEIVCSEYEL